MTDTRTCTTCRAQLGPEDRSCPDCGSDAPDLMEATPPDLGVGWNALVGRLARAVAHRYEVSELIGFGGMAGVYLATEPRLGRRVAIKLMSPALMMDPALVSRFEQEARTTAQLHHPNIVTIHDVDRRDGLHYFVMQYIEGRTLRQVFTGTPGERVPIELALHWIAQVGSALAYAHRAGVVHRDVKPGNVLIDDRGESFITDFGIAKVADEPGLTRTGFLVGTPAYMSPEQCAGSAVTGASDQYALGVLAYEMLSGTAPFTGSTMGVIQAHLSKEPPPLGELRPDCPDDVAAGITRMLAKEPGDRFPSVAAAISAMSARTLADGNPIRAWTAGVGGTESPGPGGRASLELSVPRGPLTIGEMRVLDVSLGEAVTATDISWMSSDPRIVRVTSEGVVTALRSGSVTIIAATGEHRATALLRVVAETPPVSPPAEGSEEPLDEATWSPVKDVAPGWVGQVHPVLEPALRQPSRVERQPEDSGRQVAVREGSRTWRYGLAATGIAVVAVAGWLVMSTLGGEQVPSTPQPPSPTVAGSVDVPSEVGGAAGTDGGDPARAASENPAQGGGELPADAELPADPVADPATTAAAGDVAAPPPPGRLSILGSLPAGAVLTVSGNGLNEPIHGESVELPPGTYTVSAGAPGFEGVSTTVSLRSDATITWSPTLRPMVADAVPDPVPPAPSDPDRAPAGRDPAGDAAAIRSVVTEFASSFASREVDQIYRDYPGARAALAGGWEGFLREPSVRDLAATVEEFGGPTFDGDRATVTFVMALDFRDAVRRQQPRVTFEAELALAAGAWTLTGLRILQ